MVMKDEMVKITQTIEVPPNQVYDAFRNSNAIESWFANSASVQLRENGQIFLWWNDSNWYSAGKVTKVIENQSIQFDWRGSDEDVVSNVLIELEPVNEGTQLKLTHQCEQSGIVGEEHRKGWEHFLGNLKSVLETGKDMRIFTRPMLGVFIDRVVDQDAVEKFNLPEEKGILITGVIDGMGAQKAGLQPNDVLVTMNGHELKGFADFPVALGDKKAGDEVTLTLFRGPETIETSMVLSTREVPEGLSDRDAFVDKLRNDYADSDRQLGELLSGVSEEQASKKPAENEWNAKEVLAHILYSEHWAHIVIAALLADLPAAGFNNLNSLISATANSYSLEALLQEIKIAGQITIDTLSNLPDEITKDKRKFGRMVMFFSPNNATHTISHFDQIKEALNQ